MRQQHRKLVDTPENKGQAPVVKPKVQQFRERPGVLVVDDDHLVRVMVQLGLERNGFDVWLARNGREAIGLYRAHRETIAVVLLDVRMLGLDGPQTLDALRELDPKVVACFMSGNPGDYKPEELLQRGAAHVIAKPFRLDDLLNILWPLVYGASAGALSSGKV